VVVAANNAGSVIETEVVVTHPLEQVTVHEYTPANKLLIEDVLPPLDHA
jgi:hypothetical protein